MALLETPAEAKQIPEFYLLEGYKVLVRLPDFEKQGSMERRACEQECSFVHAFLLRSFTDMVAGVNGR